MKGAGGELCSQSGVDEASAMEHLNTPRAESPSEVCLGGAN